MVPALTKLQADAFVTLDQGLAQAAATLVPVASCDQMLGERLPQPSPQGVLSLRTERRRYQLDGPLRDTPRSS